MMKKSQIEIEQKVDDILQGFAKVIRMTFRVPGYYQNDGEVWHNLGLYISDISQFFMENNIVKMECKFREANTVLIQLKRFDIEVPENISLIKTRCNRMEWDYILIPSDSETRVSPPVMQSE